VDCGFEIADLKARISKKYTNSEKSEIYNRAEGELSEVNPESEINLNRTE
jgi:hypothetical protein